MYALQLIQCKRAAQFVFFFALLIPHHRYEVNGFSINYGDAGDYISETSQYVGEQLERFGASVASLIARAYNYLFSTVEICDSKDCLKKAALIVSYMNESVDPCDDFYEFTCGNFKRDLATGATADENLISSVIPRRLKNELHYLLAKESFTAQRKAPSNSPRYHKIIKDCYESCVDEATLEFIALKPMRDKIDAMGGWPVLQGSSFPKNHSKLNAIASVFKSGFFKENIFSMRVETDPVNVSIRRLSIMSPYALSPLDSTLYPLIKMFCQSDLLSALTTSAISIAQYFGADSVNAGMDMSDVVEFECALANVASTPDDPNQFRLVPFKRLQQKFGLQSAIPKNMTIDPDELVIDKSPDYTLKLEELMNKTSDRIFQNYLVYRTVRSMLPLLNSGAIDLWNKLLSQDRTLVSRIDFCVDYTSERFSEGLTEMYLSQYFTPDIKPGIAQMTAEIRAVIRDSINNASWMEPQTREKAVKKLDSLLETVLYLEDSKNQTILEEFYKKIDWNRADLFGSEMKFYSAENVLRDLRKKKDRNSWEERTTLRLMANAVYDQQANTILINPVIGQYPLYVHGGPSYVNFGGIGSILGHEMSHAFDKTGSSFDELGNWVDWWDAETKKKFQEKVKCFEDQYSNYTFNEMPVDGVVTVGENMADNLGLAAAYEAYKGRISHETELKLPGLQKYNGNQLFWITYASQWCTNMYKPLLPFYAALDVHTFHPVRVAGSISNSRYFSEDFNCPLGTKMNPTNKCSVW